ncbi:MAG: cytochrome c oxidase assembly protein [Candidatus Eremiobacteraeota bacterium]|nr:cytochrome c oxidase assembly protein [Candidatus Eremiobacteraeota bacterium]
MSAFLAVAASGALYGWGLVRARRAGRAFPYGAVVAFAAGLATITVALSPLVDALADASFAWHMAEHLLLTSVAAPLLLLGAPLRLALAALPSRAAATLAQVLNSAPLRALTHPAFAWLQFAVVLYGTHFSPLYEAALENASVHAAEHALYLGSALLFWEPLLAVAPAPHAPPHPLRIVALFLALPMSAFLGFALYVTNRVLYPHYAAHAGALSDQTQAGIVMWLGGGGPLFVALLAVVVDWGRRERRLDAISDASST